MGFGDSFGCWNSHHFLEFHKGLHLLATKRTVEDLGIGVGVVSRRALTPSPVGWVGVGAPLPLLIQVCGIHHKKKSLDPPLIFASIWM